jgi:hypothetical protein
LENLNETAISGNLRASVVQGFVYYVSYFPYGDDVTRRNNFSNIARIFVENEPNLYNPAVGKLTRSLIEGVANFLLRYHLQESNPLTNAELKDFISNLSTESIYALLTAPEEYLFGDFYRVGFERIIEDTRGAPDFFGCLRNKGIPESAFPDILYAASKSGNLQELATGHPEIIGGSVEIILSDMMKQLQFSDTPNLAPLANTVDVFLRDKSTRAGFEEKLVAFYRGLSNTDSNRRYLDAILSTYWDRLSSSSRNLLMQDGFKVQELADYSRIPYSRLFNGGNGSELVIKQIFQEDDPFHGTANRLQQKGYELVAQEPNALVYAKTIQGRTVKHALIFMPSASATDREPLSSMPASIRAHRGHSFQTTGSLDGRGAEATCLISLGCRGFAYASSVIDNYNNDSQPHYYIPIYNGGDERGRAEFVPNTEFLISLGEDLAKGKATGIETWGELAKQNYYFRSGYVLRPDHPIVTLSIELDRRRNNNPDLTIADNSWQATGQATWDSNRRMINR